VFLKYFGKVPRKFHFRPRSDRRSRRTSALTPHKVKVKQWKHRPPPQSPSSHPRSPFYPHFPSHLSLPDQGSPQFRESCNAKIIGKRSTEGRCESVTFVTSIAHHQPTNHHHWSSVNGTPSPQHPTPPAPTSSEIQADTRQRQGPKVCKLKRQSAQNERFWK
jgi:hypothetical protein